MSTQTEEVTGFVVVMAVVLAVFGAGYLWGYVVFGKSENLPMQYEVIKAESQEDAIAKSVWRNGDLARVVGLKASSNSKGTYSVFPEFERIDVGDLELQEEEE